jgi:hypothetical protein
MKVVQINLVEVVRLYFVSRKNHLYDEQLRGHKGKTIPVQAWRDPAHQRMKVVRLSVLGTGRLYHAEKISDAHFCWRLSRTQGHSVTGRI